MNSLAKAIKTKVGGALDAVNPMSMYYRSRGKRDERNANIIRKARQYDDSYSEEAKRARSSAMIASINSKRK